MNSKWAYVLPMKGIAGTMLLAALLLAGCATPIDWNARIGVYTYNQAVKDYGPPESQTTLKDGSIVADWMTERGTVVTTQNPYAYRPGYYSMNGYYGPGWRNSSTTYFPAQFLRLAFGPDGQLKEWKEYSK
jgi:hypothetical protein